MKFVIISLILIKGILMGVELDFINYKDKKIPLIYEKTNLPIFDIQLVLKNSGYALDSKDKQGLTNILAKILNEGSSKSGKDKFFQSLEENGIHLNISNGFETFVFEISSLIQKIDTGFKKLDELLKYPNITQENIDKIKQIQLSTILQKEVDFDYIANINLYSIMYKDRKRANINLGTKETINKIKLVDIENSFKNLLNINNLIIVAGSNLKVNEFKKIITPLLDNFKDKKSNELNYIECGSDTKEKIVYKDTKQAYIYFGSCYKHNNNLEHLEKLTSYILGAGGFGSRLMEEIRVKAGLAYSAYGYIVSNKTNSYFKGYLQTKLSSQDKAINLVKKTIDEFIKHGVTDEELKSAKEFLLGSEPLRSETLSQRLNRAFNLYYKGYKLNHFEKLLQKIQNTTIDELNSYIKQQSELKKLYFSVVTKKD